MLNPKKRKRPPPTQQARPTKKPPREKGGVDEFGLTIRERAFADLYLIDQNGSAAYVRAGYTARNENVAAACASRLLTRAKVKKYIELRMKALHDKFAITQERVLGELARMAYVNVQDLFDESGNLLPIKQLPEDVARAILSVEVTEAAGGDKTIVLNTKKVKTDKTAALRLLGQHLKLFTEKVEHGGTGGGPITLALSATDLKNLRG
jgi:phage terminase small subunit